MVNYPTKTSSKAKVKAAAATAKRKKAAAAKPKAAKPQPLPELSPKALEVLGALLKGNASSENIAFVLGVSEDQAVKLVNKHGPHLIDAEEDDFDPALIGGRPAVWNPRYVSIGKTMAALGSTDLELSQAFDVSVRTIHRWKIEHPEFREALRQGKDIIDDKVEESLLKRATGYSFDSEKVMVVDKELQRVQTLEHVPPDPKAAMFWLQNRRPGLWRATHHIKHDIEPESQIASFLAGVSGQAFKPKDQDGPAENDQGEAPRAFSPASDEQETGPDEAV